MPRFFFDVHEDNKDPFRDEEGTELPNLEAARKSAMKLLPDMARDEILRDGDKRALTVLVTDEDGKPVYTATLNFAGLWLLR